MHSTPVAKGAGVGVSLGARDEVKSRPALPPQRPPGPPPLLRSGRHGDARRWRWRGGGEAQRRSAARTPAKKAAASSSVNPATGQTLVLDTKLDLNNFFKFQIKVASRL